MLLTRCISYEPKWNLGNLWAVNYLPYHQYFGGNVKIPLAEFSRSAPSGFWLLRSAPRIMNTLMSHGIYNKHICIYICMCVCIYVCMYVGSMTAPIHVNVLIYTPASIFITQTPHSTAAIPIFIYLSPDMFDFRQGWNAGHLGRAEHLGFAVLNYS